VVWAFPLRSAFTRGTEFKPEEASEFKRIPALFVRIIRKESLFHSVAKNENAGAGEVSLAKPFRNSLVVALITRSKCSEGVLRKAAITSERWQRPSQVPGGTIPSAPEAPWGHRTGRRAASKARGLHETWGGWRSLTPSSLGPLRRFAPSPSRQCPPGTGKHRGKNPGPRPPLAVQGSSPLALAWPGPARPLVSLEGPAVSGGPGGPPFLHRPVSTTEIPPRCPPERGP